MKIQERANKTPNNADHSKAERIAIDHEDLMDLQLFFDEIKNKYGINIQINHNISAYENEVIAQNKCNEFWNDIFDSADRFLKIYESHPTSYTTTESGERFLNTENLEKFTDIELHPFSVIVIVNSIQRNDTNLHKLKIPPSPLDNEKYSGISTAEFAHRIGVQPDSIRVRLCTSGSYFGIIPHKLPNKRSLWPIDAVQRLVESKKQKKK